MAAVQKKSKKTTRKTAARKTAKKRRAPSRQVMEARTKGLSFLNRAAFVLLLILICVAVAVTVFPQLKKLKRLEADLELTKARETQAINLLDQRSRELQALRNDTEFQELRSRDLLNWYQPSAGETVIRIQRD